MIGIVVVTHRQLGEALIDSAQFILDERPEATVAVSIDLKEHSEKLIAKIRAGMKEVNQREGILILTDMFGGTPSNLSYSLLEEGKIEVLSGVNLPMLVKAIKSRKDKKLNELCLCLEEYGKKSISLASAVLKGNKKTK